VIVYPAVDIRNGRCVQLTQGRPDTEVVHHDDPAAQAALWVSLGADAKRLMIATSSGALGRAMKLRVVPGGVAQTVERPVSSNGGGRGRAEQDPVVKRMKEKFGAEIRTIIDYKEKR